ncbi:MAG TPA: oxygenase MpaB family protein [Acidimicrobiales bacterium]|nr:oxygenase MpaB family protein [Acidimicrobiales bacterium]
MTTTAPSGRASTGVLALPSVGWRPPLPTPAELAVGLSAGMSGRLAAPLLAGPLQVAFGRALGGERPAEKSDADIEGWGDPGWFGPGSATWAVHGDHSMLVSGFAAFALQALHPRALAGVVEHSAFDDDFMGRTRRTGEYVLNVSFGTTRQAERFTTMLPRIHDRVVGTAPDGRPYAANEPELLDFVHVTQFVATAAAHQRFGSHPLDDAGLDRYIAENTRVGAAVGVLDPPTTWDEAMAALDRHRPNLAIGEQASEGLRYLASPPFLPAAARPLWRALHTGALACLPPFARRLMGLGRPNPADVALCRGLVRSLGALLPPPAIAVEARRRLARPRVDGPQSV